MQWVWVQSLVWELRSHMPHGQKRRKTETEQKTWAFQALCQEQHLAQLNKTLQAVASQNAWHVVGAQ